MGLVCLSFSHQHTPIAFREKIHFNQNAVANACARFRCGEDRSSQMLELAILSTCNRTELFVYFSDKGGIDHSPKIIKPNFDDPFHTGAEEFSEFNPFDQAVEDSFLDELKQELLTFVSQARAVEVHELQPLAKWFWGAEVVSHIARVAAGLESMVLGEPQILGQVGDAMRMGIVMNSTGPVLTKLFQTAISCGRRARKETQIGSHSANISTLAVGSAEQQLEGLDGKSVVLLGAGVMADLALSQLRRKNVGKIMVVNRTIFKAKELANKHHGTAHVFEQISEVMSQADVLISSTGAPHTLIDREMVAEAMRPRYARRLVILDIAIPRDVDVAVEEVENVWRCDLDDLQRSAGESLQARESAIPEVEVIVDFEVERYLKWLRGVGIERTVAALRKKTETIRSSELQRLIGLLPNLSEETLQVIDQFSRSLTNKLFHDPTAGLRNLEGSRSATNHGEAIRELFHLGETQQTHNKSQEIPAQRDKNSA